MQYYGGKAKTARYIAPIINEIKHFNNIQWTIEPFCGACNITYRLDGDIIAADNNPYVIAMWQALQRGWIPPDTITKNQYDAIKKNKDVFPKELIGFVGHGCTFGGRWFAGYGKQDKRPGHKSYCIRAKLNTLKRIKTMKSITFIECDYEKAPLPCVPCIIYCDPPYYHTSAAGYYDKHWDHRHFYAWCDKLVEIGHIVLISDSKAPIDFVPIWQKQFTRCLKCGKNNTENKKTTELLCAHVTQLNKIPIDILTGNFFK